MYKRFTVLVLHVEDFKIFVYDVSISFLLSWLLLVLQLLYDQH